MILHKWMNQYLMVTNYDPMPKVLIFTISTLGRDTFTQKSEFQLGRYELVLQMYPVDQRKKI